MLVLVSRSDLANGPVKVLASYADKIPAEMMRPEFTVLTINPRAIRHGAVMGELAPDWRETCRGEIVKGEARRRILAAFPEHEQRNAALELGLFAAHYGSAAWPKEAHRRREAIESAWAHLNAIKEKARAMLAGPLPADPTADSLWPRRG
jgi:hypothetical protein